MVLTARLRCICIAENSKARIFKNLEIGDIIKIYLDLSQCTFGSKHRITVENEKRNEQAEFTLTEFKNASRYFRFTQIT